MTQTIERMKHQLAVKERKRRKEALRQLEEIELMTHALTSCVRDCNGVPDYAWKPDLEEADRLIRLLYWKTARVRALLESRDTDGIDIEIALAELTE